MIKISIILLFSTIIFLSAQEDSLVVQDSLIEDKLSSVDDKFRSIEIKFHSGTHLYSGDGLEEVLENGYGAAEVRYAWQTTEKDEWASQYGFPQYGVGFYTGAIGDPSVLGNPNGLYGFINFPLSKYFRRNRFYISPALGLSYDLKPYDAENNPLNDAIGAKMAVYFNLAFGAAYNLNKDLDLIYGIDFTHFSNGRSVTPNWGLNMFGLNIGLRYNYNARQRKVDKRIFPETYVDARFRPKKKTKNTPLHLNNIKVYTAIGTVQNDDDKGTDTRYTVFSGVLDYEHQFNNMHSISAGLDFFYDPSLKANENPPDSYWMPGIHAGYAFGFYRFKIHLQVGTYFGDDNDKTPLYLRPAIEYHFSKFFSAQIGLKTRNGAAADWVEFGVGFRPFRW